MHMWTQLRLIGRLAVGAAFVIFVASATDAIAQAPAGGAAKPAAQTSQRPPATNPVKDGWITFKIHSAYVPEERARRQRHRRDDECRRRDAGRDRAQ